MNYPNGRLPQNCIERITYQVGIVMQFFAMTRLIAGDRWGLMGVDGDKWGTTHNYLSLPINPHYSLS